jgi:hypothetical protein
MFPNLLTFHLHDLNPTSVFLHLNAFYAVYELYRDDNIGMLYHCCSEALAMVLTVVVLRQDIN